MKGRTMDTGTQQVDERARVVLPAAFAGRTVVVESVTPNEVRVRAVASPRRRPALAQLLAGITDTNIHEAAEFGSPAGGEAL